MGPAADHWRTQLEAWVIPQRLLDSVPDSPYSWPVDLWKRRDRSVASTPTNERILSYEPTSVLDIGAGVGGSCLVIAERGVLVTAVEPDPGMASALEEVGAQRHLPITVVAGRWPQDADSVGRVHVATASHVVHNVPDLGPFLIAMADKAERAVVIQEFAVHPWAHLGHYYQALHALDRPTGPTDDDLVAVVEEVLGVTPHIERWEDGRPMVYRSWDEILDFYSRRLVLPAERRRELRELLAPDFVEVDGGLAEKDRRRSKATIWWESVVDPAVAEPDSAARE